jgi:hypothetical protein
MTYALLGHSLHETADLARKHFADAYGAKNFECETAVDQDLPLRPTWQATMQGNYKLCIEVMETPFSQSLYEFVIKCANRGIPVRLWVAVPWGVSGGSFAKELKEARTLGVGVIQISEDGTQTHEFHKPVSFSLFGLRRTDLTKVRKAHREAFKKAEDAFIDGSPDYGCQLVCQDLESVTRSVALHTYSKKWWTTKQGLKPRFFTSDAWATMLEKFDKEIDVTKTRKKCPSFRRALVAGARQYTDWRNSLSHKPKSLKELEDRDARLRTMFEATRDHLIEWLNVAHVLKS